MGDVAQEQGHTRGVEGRHEQVPEGGREPAEARRRVHPQRLVGRARRQGGEHGHQQRGAAPEIHQHQAPKRRYPVNEHLGAERQAAGQGAAPVPALEAEAEALAHVVRRQG